MYFRVTALFDTGNWIACSVAAGSGPACYVPILLLYDLWLSYTPLLQQHYTSYKSTMAARMHRQLQYDNNHSRVQSCALSTVLPMSHGQKFSTFAYLVCSHYQPCPYTADYDITTKMTQCFELDLLTGFGFQQANQQADTSNLHG